MTIDIAMTILLPLLMAYSLIGETFHEAIGTVIFVLFILHHILNRRWYGSLFRGKYTVSRAFQNILDAVLFVFMIAQPVSGILMSKHLYTFIYISGAASSAREVHLFLAYWGYILLCIHAGTHLTSPVKKLERRSKTAAAVLGISSLAVSIYGAYAFVKRQFPDYMFRKSSFVFFDYSEPKVFFFLDYLAIMVLFITIGFWIKQFMKQ